MDNKYIFKFPCSLFTVGEKLVVKVLQNIADENGLNDEDI